MNDRLEQMFPPFALRIECGPLRLRAVREFDVPLIADAVNRDGIYDDGRPMPFLARWPEQLGEHGLPTAQFYWGLYANWSANSWHVPLLVEHDGQLVGTQDMGCTRPLATMGVVETGSWLLRSAQGKGIGTLMRQAVCAFAFDELGATQMVSSAFADNPRSRAVSRKVGYRENGVRRVPDPDGHGFRNEVQFLLEPDHLVCPPYPVVATGVAGFRASIGLD